MAISWSPWGKLRRAESGQVASTHPLLDHMIDVAACMEALIACHGIAHALSTTIGRPLTQVDICRLQVITFLHDIGKANAGFQARFWQFERDTPRYWPQHCGHGADGWVLFSAPDRAAGRILQGLPATMEHWGDGVYALLRASISHHGRPIDEKGAHGAHVWQAVKDGPAHIYDPAEAVAAMGNRIQQLYQPAFDDKATQLPDNPAFVHLFAGLVQLADWLGSDTRDGFFPYSQAGEDRATTAPQRAAHAVRAIG